MDGGVVESDDVFDVGFLGGGIKCFGYCDDLVGVGEGGVDNGVVVFECFGEFIDVGWIGYVLWK